MDLNNPKQPLKIFVGEDQKSSLAILKQILEDKLGQTIISQATSGTEVLVQLKKLIPDSPDWPDALWLDIGMEPEPDGGLECARTAWQRYRLPSVIYTGKDEPDLIEGLLQERHIIAVVIKNAPAAQFTAALGSIRKRKTAHEENRLILHASCVLTLPTDDNLFAGEQRLIDYANSHQLPLVNAAEHILQQQADCDRLRNEIKELEEKIAAKKTELTKKLKK